VVGALIALGLLGALSLPASELPRWLAWPLALLAALAGVRAARAEWRKPHRQLVWPGGVGPVSVEGKVVTEAVVAWRGPLAFLRWRGPDGRLHRLGWWPDTLAPDARRELWLALEAGNASRSPPPMAR
jgi:toxin CptA